MASYYSILLISGNDIVPISKNEILFSTLFLLIGQIINANLYFYANNVLILNEKNKKKDDFQSIVNTSNKVMN